MWKERWKRGSERERVQNELLLKKRERERRREKNESEMICGPLQCASITRMALLGGMKGCLIVWSGNVISALLALIDLFTFQRLEPVCSARQKTM